ncbi:MAG: mannose-6-phosphate isomerase, class I [Spirochaetales bacterium]|nr:mannose-6-phosphate isomerase, class I [Spirochaetales bacterium]
MKILKFPDRKILVLHNTIQTYNWGSKEYISRLLGRASPSPGPEAELWMGAHPNAPSLITSDSRRISLLEYINKNPVKVLGKETAMKFNNALPFLFKVLAADRPLSIQAHPDKSRAVSGFQKENARGVPLDARNRIYKDKNHKPEIICALTPFTALNGFMSIDKIIELLESIKSTSLDPFLIHLKQNRNESGLKLFFKSIMTCDVQQKDRIISDILHFAETQGNDDPRDKWILSLHREYPGDIGIICMFLLNFIVLQPGEAMFLPDCQFHSYIHGAGIELMANSDNVLRGGLTPKHIDIPELVEIINFAESDIQIIRPGKNRNHEKIYVTPAEEFLLTGITLERDTLYTSAKNRSVEIVLCIEGDSIITGYPDGETLGLKKGISVFIPASLDYYTIRGKAHIFRASVPLST